MFSSKVGLWFLRKAVYVAGGAVVAVVGNQLSGASGAEYDLGRITLSGILGGTGAAVLGDLRRALMPDVLQVVTGQDPRKDG